MDNQASHAQVRTFMHLPLALLALRLRMRVRQPSTWAHAALICGLMLLPTGAIFALERRARRAFLASRLGAAQLVTSPSGSMQAPAALCQGSCAPPQMHHKHQDKRSVR